MEKKIFSVALLKIGEVPFTLDSFSKIPESDSEDIKIKDEVQHNKIIKKEIRDNKYVSIYIEEGDIMPRPEVVYDTLSKAEKENPRSKNEIERNTQTFILIDIETQRIFLSDFRKRKTIGEWISEKIDQPVIVKNIIDKSEFLNNINGINTIYLSAVPNLFSSAGILSQELAQDHHNYGVGIKHIGVKIKFEENSLPDKLKNFVTNLFQQQENESIQKLEISGRYSDDRFERVFNTDGIIDKIELDINPRDDGLFEPQIVFDSLIQKIQ